MKNIFKLSLALLAFGAILGAAPLAPTLTISPGSRTILPSTNYGFGYVIVNEDPALWLVPVGIQPLSDVPGLLTWSATDVFDYPILAPLASTGTIPWIQDTQGLIQFTTAAILSFSSPYSGTITVDFEYYDDDPLSGGTLVDTISASAEFTLDEGTPGEVPEPATWVTLAAGLGLVLISRRRR